MMCVCRITRDAKMPLLALPPVRPDSLLSWSRLPVGYSLLVDFSFNKLNQNKLLKPPLHPQMRSSFSKTSYSFYAFIWTPVFLAPGLVSSWRQVLCIFAHFVFLEHLCTLCLELLFALCLENLLHFALDRCALLLGHRPGCTPFIGSSLAVY